MSNANYILERRLENGIAIKGSYKMSVKSGTWVDLYVISPDGLLMGNYTFAFKGAINAPATIHKLVEKVEELLVTRRVHTVNTTETCLALSKLINSFLKKHVDKAEVAVAA